MAKPVYKGFTPLNHRRGELIFKKYQGGGLSEREEEELEMLQAVTSAMLDYAFRRSTSQGSRRRRGN